MEMPLETIGDTYMLLRFAREGIPPSEYKQLTVHEREVLRGILTGEHLGFKHKRGNVGS